MGHGNIKFIFINTVEATYVITLGLDQCEYINQLIILTDEKQAKKVFRDQLLLAKLITLTNLI